MIKNIEVRNFKSLKHVRVGLALRNVLVGPNMSGKSNLIDVFRLLNRMLTPAPGTYGLPNALQSMGGFLELIWKGGDTNLISIRLEGDLPIDSGLENAGTWEYQISVLGDQRGWATVQDEALLVSRRGDAQSLIGKDSTGYRVLRNADGKVRTQMTDPSRSALEYEIPDWEGNAVRNLIASWRFYGLIPGLMKQANPSAAARFLTEHGDNLSSWLMTIQTTHRELFDKITRVASDVFPDLESIFTIPTQQATVFVASRERHLKQPIGVWQMSDGQLVFVALLSLIFGPSEHRDGLYCIEEPENHLHPRLLETLVELLKQLQDELRPEERGQIIISTHSPHLVDKFDLDEIIVAERSEGATVLTRPSNKTHLRELLERQEVGLGELFYSGALGSV